MNPSSRPSTRPGSRSGSRFVSSDNLRAPPVAVNDNGEESSQVTSLGSQPLGPNVATKQASNSNNTATNSDPSLFYLPIEYTSITGHRFSSLRLLLYVFLSIMTCGLLPFACLYLPWLRTYLIRESCSHFRDAQFVLVLSSDGTWHELKVSELSEESHLELNNPDVHYHGSYGSTTRETYTQMRDDVEYRFKDKTTTRTYKYFQYRKQRYVFQEGANTFVRINSRLHVNFESLHPLRYGLSEQEAEALLSKNGENIIDVETVPILKMLLDKVVHPFYLFQAASVLIWTYESYFLYSYIIAFTSISSIIWEIYLSKRNEHSLRSLLKEEFEVFVLRSNGPGTIGVPTLIQARHLVVGDAILLDAESSTTTAMADVVLLQGSCVVDESSLTGESVPVVKTSLGYFERRGELFSADKCKNSIVYAGSKIVEFKPQAYSIPDKDEDAQLKRVVGVVIATGFNSTKGQLFRGILYPNRVDIKFYKDALIFIGTLGLIAIAAFTNRLIHGLKQGYGTFWVVITSLDIITIAVPPALPLVLTVGVSQALRRLKKNGIFCIAPDRINYAGRIDLFCWDKTGTLTTSKVTWAGVEKSRECTFTGFRPTLRKDGDGDMERAIAACHSLNLINDELVGSTVDVELFEATKFRLAQDEPTAMLNGHIFPVIARVYKPLPKLPATPQSTPRSPNLPDVEPVMTKPLSIQIPKPTVLDTLIASPTGITPTCFPNSSSSESLLILRRFDFDSKLQRTSVIFKPTPNNRTATPNPTAGAKQIALPWEALTVVTKGSPETIRNICKQSTIPSDYHATYTRYATAGWYVLALASKSLDEEEPHSQIPTIEKSSSAPSASLSKGSAMKLKKSMSMRKMAGLATGDSSRGSPGGSIQSGLKAGGSGICNSKDSTLKITTAEDLAAITRDQVERDLKFLGFVLLKNPLKSESQSTVSLLTDAGIKSVIITGDNVMTGISVARQLSLCKQVLLVDVFDGVVGFRRLNQDILDPEASQKHHTIDLHHASSIDSLVSQQSPTVTRKKILPKVHHAVSTSELTNSDEDSIGPQSLHLGTNPASVPRIRIRSATTTSNGSAAQRHQQEVKDSFKVYPLDQIARMQNEISDSAEIAITGPALDMFIATREGWKENLVGEKFLDWLVLKGVVFARMKPDQKTWIIERMMKLGKYVGMCGDGANDTGALKAAHVGLALSDAEASIVAPFTSGQRKVADVVRLIREGRCALDINFMAFKFMFMYPLIQLSMMATLTQVDSGLSNNQYLFDDLFVVLTLAFFMLRSSASRQLAPHRPTDDLLSAPIIYSLIGQVAICSGFFAVNYYSLISEDDWFCSIEIAKSKLNSSWMPINTTASLDVSYPCYPINPETDTIDRILIKSYENTVIWLFSHFQFAILSLAFIFTSPHRKPLYTNILYILTFLTVSGVMVLMQLSWEEWQGFDVMQQIFSIREGVQWGHRIESLYLAATNLLVSLVWETIVIDRFVRRWVESRETMDHKKLENRIGKQAGVLSANEGSEQLRNKRNYLQQFGIITGIMNKSAESRTGGGDGSVAWEGYVQTVVSATAGKHLDTRLDMAAHLKNTRSWGDMNHQEESMRVSSTPDGEQLGSLSIIGDRFEVEDGKDDGFDKGFDAWREGRRQTLK